MDQPGIDPVAFNAFEAAGWERQAAGYDAFFGGVTSRLAEPLLDAAAVGAGTRMLDVATGPGYVAAAAAGRGAAVLGIDVAAAMVGLARRLHPTIDFRQADVHELPFEDCSFDAVVGNFVILHLGDPERAVAELARVLAPGGRLALTTWDLPDRARILGVFLDAVAEAGVTPPADVPAGPDVFRFADESQFDALLAGGGLGERELTTIGFTYSVSSADELWEGLLAGTVRMSVLMRGQSREVLERTRSAFDRRMAAYRRADGGYELPVSVKLAVGTRGAQRSYSSQPTRSK